MPTTIMERATISKECTRFEDLLIEFKNAHIVDIVCNTSLVNIRYSINDEEKIMITTKYCLLAAIQYVQPFFKTPLESLLDSHTDYKTHS